VSNAAHRSAAAAAAASPLTVYLGLYLLLLAFFLHLVGQLAPLPVAATPSAGDEPPPAAPAVAGLDPARLPPAFAAFTRLLAPMAVPAPMSGPQDAVADPLELVVAGLFEPGTAALAAAARPTVAGLARELALAAEPPVTLTLLVGGDTAPRPGSATMGMDDMAARQAAALAQALLAAGAPADRFAVGILLQAAGRVRVILRLDADHVVPPAPR
jgi:hypothetical protein